jgi:tetratricopeptide (TPR) repeat protein
LPSGTIPSGLFFYSQIGWVKHRVDGEKKKMENKEAKNFEEEIRRCAKEAKLNPNSYVVFKDWGNALSNLAEIKQDEALFMESFEKYKQAIQIKPDYAVAFYDWGIALCELAKIKQNESLFRESFEKYKQAAELKPRDADIFYSYGIALYNLAKVKKDENLFMESFEKYKQATELAPSDIIFYNWGLALYNLAKVKKDENLFMESFEKYKQATQIKLNYADAFYNWGVALCDLYKIKQDENLLIESIEKYEQAAQIEPDYADTFYNWGLALYELAKIKKDENLLIKSIEKYKQAAELEPRDADIFCNWGVALYELAEIKQNEIFRKNFEIFEIKSKDINDTDTLLIKGKLYFFSNQTEKAMEYFTKSKKDILEILTFLDKENGEKMIDTNFLHPLLDLDNNDGAFFREATKKFNEEQRKKLDAYKEVYIRSIFIISLLHVKEDEEEFVAHYREKEISQTLLFSSDDNLNKLRLNAIDYSNDLDEGKTLLDFLYGKEKRPSDKELNIEEYEVFACCFVFDYDSLNLFRLYGKEKDKEGTGLSLVFGESFFNKNAKMALGLSKTNSCNMNNDDSPEEEKSALFRCIYIDPLTCRMEAVGQKEKYLFYRENEEKKKEGKEESDEDIERKIDKYYGEIRDIIDKVRDKMKKLKELVKDLNPTVVGQLLINLRYLVKHIAFKEEQECRIIKILKLDDKDIKHTEKYEQLYVKYSPKVSEHIDKIYFGPKMLGCELFQSMLKHKGLNIPCEKSTNPLA